MGTAGLALAPAAVQGQAPAAPAQGVKLGVASYSLRKFSRADAIMMVNALGTPYINLKSFHMPYDAPPAELAGARRELKAAGLETTLHAYGTNIEGEWDAVMAAVKRCHETVHEMGAPRVSTTLKLGTRTDRPQTMADKVNSVTEKLS